MPILQSFLSPKHRVALGTLLIFIHWAHQAQATVVVERNEQKQLILKAESCDIVKEQIKALSGWTVRIGENLISPANAMPILNPKPDSNGLILKCFANITGIVPQVVRMYHGTNPSYDGPNCWNSSLVVSHLLPAIRYSTSEEMSLWMDSPFCQALKDDQALIAGDVVAVREAESETTTEEIHGFIYLTNQLSFSKNGYAQTSPFALQALENVFQVYGVDQKPICRRTSKIENQCYRYANYYRCHPIDKELKAYESNNSEFKNTEATLNKWETVVSQVAITGVQGSFQRDQALVEIQAVEPTIDRWVVKLTPAALLSGTARKALFLWKTLSLRASSTIEQLSLINLP